MVHPGQRVRLRAVGCPPGGDVWFEEGTSLRAGPDGSFTTEFEIPPGSPNHEVAASYRFEKDSILLSFFPHMHLRGKAYRYELIYPDQRREVLLNVPRYDFNWQLHYKFREPIAVPAGSKGLRVAVATGGGPFPNITLATGGPKGRFFTGSGLRQIRGKLYELRFRNAREAKQNMLIITSGRKEGVAYQVAYQAF